MRISKQISGNATERGIAIKQGRGEYEWCELTPADPTREELLGRRVTVVLPSNLAIDTGCVLAVQGGKNRIRVDPSLGSKRDIYPHYHVGIALLMPRSTRQEQEWGGGLPVMRSLEYSIVDIRFGRAALAGQSANSVDVSAELIGIQNQYSQESIIVAERFARVNHIWENRSRLPEGLAELIEAHEDLVRSGGMVAPVGLSIVHRIQLLTADYSRDMPGIIGVSSIGDPLPVLLQMTGLAIEPAPIPIEFIPPDLTEVRRREVKNRRTVIARGSAAVRFRADVRKAYNSTCFICGKRLPAVIKGGNPGVDSCHILPFSDFDLDSTSNGLCLCKLDHWAFDEGFIEVRSDGAGGYEIAVPDEILESAEQAGMDMGWLRNLARVVPRESLPKSRRDWPNPTYLARLREILYPPS